MQSKSNQGVRAQRLSLNKVLDIQFSPQDQYYSFAQGTPVKIRDNQLFPSESSLHEFERCRKVRDENNELLKIHKQGVQRDINQKRQTVLYSGWDIFLKVIKVIARIFLYVFCLSFIVTIAISLIMELKSLQNWWQSWILRIIAFKIGFWTLFSYIAGRMDLTVSPGQGFLRSSMKKYLAFRLALVQIKK